MTGLTILLILTVQVITTSVGFRLHDFDRPAAAACKIDLAINGKDTPLVVTENGKFLYPRSQSFIKDQKIVISCPGGSFTDSQLKGLSAATVKCVSGTTFQTIKDSKNINFAQQTCTFNDITNPPPRCNVKVGQSCYLNNRGKLYQIGFKITGAKSFVPEYEVCFDESAATPLYAKVKMPASILEKNSKRPRCNCFRDVGDIFKNLQPSIDIDTVYKDASSTIEKLTHYSHYIPSDNWISRGHLVANADMFYSIQRTATFTYINAAPQWYLFNDKNWGYLEEAVRTKVNNTNTSLVLYTGTLGVTSLGDKGNPQDTPIDIYLLYPLKKVPMPRWFWKTYDCKMFFFGYNNPWHDETTANKEFAKICYYPTNIATLPDFSTIILHNQTWGFMYACDSSSIYNKELQYFINKECTQK